MIVSLLPLLASDVSVIAPLHRRRRCRNAVVDAGSIDRLSRRPARPGERIAVPNHRTHILAVAGDGVAVAIDRRRRARHQRNPRAGESRIVAGAGDRRGNHIASSSRSCSRVILNSSICIESLKIVGLHSIGYCSGFRICYSPTARTSISGSDGSSVGGWGNGAQTCEDCYLEYVNRQQWVAHVGVTYTDSMRVVAVCTGGGQFFGTSIEPYFLSIGSTYGELDGLSEDPKDGDPIGEYIKECSGGLPAVCPPFQPYGIEFGKGQYPWQYAHTYSLEIWKQNGSNPPTLTGCVMDPTSTQASGPGPCN